MSKSSVKGAKFEQACADYMSERLCGEVVRRRTAGAYDKGDLYGLKCRGKRVAVECKDCKDMKLSKWVDEAEAEKENDGAEYGVVVHHRKGKGAKQFGDTYVTMTLDTFLAMCVGGFDLLY